MESPLACDWLFSADGEVGREERVGELAGDDGLWHDLALGGGRRLRCLVLVLLGRLEPGLAEHVVLERLGRVGDGGVLLQQDQERGVARGALGEDRGHALEPLELLGAVGLRGVGVGLDPGPLLAHQLRDDLELRAHRRHDGAAFDGALDVADGAREHGDDAVVRTSRIAARGGTTAAGSASTSSGH